MLKEQADTGSLRRGAARMALCAAFDIHASDDVLIIRQALAEVSGPQHFAHLRDLVALRWIEILLKDLPEELPERNELGQLWRQAYQQAVDV